MNSKINILPEHVANKIAAGEVVQRPESVVKELIENSIDANADEIHLVIKQAGKSLIQVIDNGEGMSEEDVKKSFLRHATSKIKDENDLENIRSLGFRGEALSSIAAVSNFEIKTERKEDQFGSEIKLFENSEYEFNRGSFAQGTVVTVRNLFFNLPARRNFLKSNTTELKHIIDTFNKYSLAYPSIEFKFTNDGDLLFHYKKENLESRIQNVIADNITGLTIKIEEITDYLTLKGYIAKPATLKDCKTDQYLFVNNRSVMNRSINHAVFSAYGDLLEKGEYPFFVLFLNIDPKYVDVNVHPSKLEVKFENDKEIYSFVNAVVKKGLGTDEFVPIFPINSITGSRNTSRFEDDNEFDGFSSRSKRNFNKEYSGKGALSEDDLNILFSSINKELRTIKKTNGDHPFAPAAETEILSDSLEIEGGSSSSTSFIVSMHNRYILSQIKSGLMIIDQHRAHQRVLYEKAVKSFKSDFPFSQQLLFSQTLKLDPDDFKLTKQLEDGLQKLGFEIKFFGKNTIVIDGVPSDVKLGNESEIFFEILEYYRQLTKRSELGSTEKLALAFAQKASIKYGDAISENEMRILVDQLFATSKPMVSPDGMPTLIKIKTEDLDKWFGRS